MLYTKPTYSQPHNCTSMLIYTLHTRSSLHVNSLRLPSLSLTSPSLHCTSLHFIPHFFTSLCFWTFRHHASKTLHFSSLITTFLTLLLKICNFQRKVASTSAGSWFHSLIILFTKEYLPTPVLSFPGPAFMIVIVPAQVAWSF